MNYYAASDLLSQFYMVYKECLTSIHKTDQAFAFLSVLWHMFAEVEQIHYLICSEMIQKDEYQNVLSFIDKIQKQIQLPLALQDIETLSQEICFQDDSLQYIFKRYLNHMQILKEYKDLSL